MAEPFAHWSRCLGCGKDNPHSHGIVREYDDEGGVFARVHIDEDHGGAKGIAHGGFLSFLLDEVMGGTGNEGDEHRVTTQMAVRFLRPVLLGSDVVVAAHVENRDERGLEIRSTVTVVGADEPAVEATATFRFVDLARLRKRT